MFLIADMAQEPQGKFFDRVKNLDLYALIEVAADADVKTIKKAYRKKALTCHPDKNPDNKAAVDLFHQLSDALEVLSDEKTRTAYDNLLKARKAQELRLQKLDGKRRKLRDALEERERDAKIEETISKVSEEEKLAKEIERLRKEGSRLLEEEQEMMKQRIREERLGASSGGAEVSQPRIKVRWDKRSSCQYSRDQLEKIFSKYGSVSAVVISEKKGGSALVEFDSLMPAQMALNIETGFTENKLKIKGLWETEVESSNSSTNVNNVNQSAASDPSLLNRDFESLVMRKLRQEEERKRLIKQMMEEDG